jgi:TnpA family transposase
LLGFSYAPRIKNLKKQNLDIFKSRGNIDRSEWKIMPDKYINIVLIKENWDDILRLIATIKLKETLARTDSQENKSTLLTAIETHSVVSWAHINLLGEYDFPEEKLKDSVGINPPKLTA